MHLFSYSSMRNIIITYYYSEQLKQQFEYLAHIFESTDLMVVNTQYNNHAQIT